MSKALYMHIRWAQPVEQDLFFARLRWRLAHETGWSLEYIDSLELSDLNEYLTVMDAEHKGSKNK